MILPGGMFGGILMEEGEGCVGKHIMQIRRLLTSESKMTGLLQILATLWLSS